MSNDSSNLDDHPDQPTSSGTSYSFYKLQHDCKYTVSLPTDWCYIDLNSKLVYFHTNKKRVTTTVIINEFKPDTATISKFDVITITSNYVIKDFVEFRELLQSIELVRVCKGYNLRRHRLCYQVIRIEQGFTSNNVVCPNCRKLKTKKMKKYQVRYNRIKQNNRIIANMKRRIKKTRLKLKLLKNQMYVLLDIIQKMFLENEIICEIDMSLPPFARRLSKWQH